MYINFQNSVHRTLCGQFAKKTRWRFQHTQNALLVYFVKYKVSKLAPNEAKTWDTWCTWTIQNVMSWYQASKPNHKFIINTPNSTCWCHLSQFFHGDFGLKCSKRCLLRNWLKRTVAAQNCCWVIDVIFTSFSAVHINYTAKIKNGVWSSKE